ncbi:hypothetical protein HG530_006327 [Fusarium avenaceum]|nr:hypothetical protein HG530_006327 [Fusarium avenaceum]
MDDIATTAMGKWLALEHCDTSDVRSFCTVDPVTEIPDQIRPKDVCIGLGKHIPLLIGAHLPSLFYHVEELVLIKIPAFLHIGSAVLLRNRAFGLCFVEIEFLAPLSDVVFDVFQDIVDLRRASNHPGIVDLSEDELGAWKSITDSGPVGQRTRGDIKFCGLRRCELACETGCRAVLISYDLGCAIAVFDIMVIVGLRIVRHLDTLKFLVSALLVLVLAVRLYFFFALVLLVALRFVVTLKLLLIRLWLLLFALGLMLIGLRFLLVHVILGLSCTLLRLVFVDLRLGQIRLATLRIASLASLAGHLAVDLFIVM